MRLEGWKMDNCIRHTAYECEIEVIYTIDGKLLAHPSPLISSKDNLNLFPNSWYKFPLAGIVGETHEEEVVYLEPEVEDISTATHIPELRIPPNTNVLAEIWVKSKSIKKPVKSKWNIAIMIDHFHPLIVERLKE